MSFFRRSDKRIYLEGIYWIKQKVIMNFYSFSRPLSVRSLSATCKRVRWMPAVWWPEPRDNNTKLTVTMTGGDGFDLTPLGGRSAPIHGRSTLPGERKTGDLSLSRTRRHLLGLRSVGIKIFTPVVGMKKKKKIMERAKKMEWKWDINNDKSRERERNKQKGQIDKMWNKVK